MERQQLMNKKGANPSSTNLAVAAVPAEEPGRLKYMNLQNIQAKRMPSTETRMQTTNADRVKAANN
jgi:hypothetical protein